MHKSPAAPQMILNISIPGQACPHVAGIVANLLRIEGNMTPTQMKARVMQLSRNNAVILQGM